MCTLTWFCHDNRYHVFFNRDEQRTRSTALPPQVFSEVRGRFVMPIDTQGRGSWIATNQFGVTFALLNFYQGDTPLGELTSRGSIIQSVAHTRSYEEALAVLQTKDFGMYAPFTLTVFCPAVLQSHQRVCVLRWNGAQLQEFTSAGPLISSSVRFKDVSEKRLNAYRNYLGAHECVSAHLEYHASHYPEKSASSVCMHREDACTVSFSHIEVDSQESTFHYTDGSPCETDCEYQVTLKLADKIVVPSAQSVTGRP